MQKLGSRLDRPIVLVGLMGAGKSTVGRRLAKRLGLPFVDSDDAIEDAAGFSAAELFDRYGDALDRSGSTGGAARSPRILRILFVSTTPFAARATISGSRLRSRVKEIQPVMPHMSPW